MKVKMKELNDIIRNTAKAYHDVSVRLGISDSVFNILYILCEEGEGCRQSVLYKKSGIRKTTVNSAIRKMEKQGLLFLKPGEGRNTCIFLTEEGRTFLKDKIEPVIMIENEIMDSMTEEERSLFLQINRCIYLEFVRRALGNAGQEEMGQHEDHTVRAFHL